MYTLSKWWLYVHCWTTLPHCSAFRFLPSVLHAGCHTVSYPLSPVSAPRSIPSVLQQDLSPLPLHHRFYLYSPPPLLLSGCSSEVSQWGPSLPSTCSVWWQSLLEQVPVEPHKWWGVGPPHPGRQRLGGGGCWWELCKGKRYVRNGNLLCTCRLGMIQVYTNYMSVMDPLTLVELTSNWEFYSG